MIIGQHGINSLCKKNKNLLYHTDFSEFNQTTKIDVPKVGPTMLLNWDVYNSSKSTITYRGKTYPAILVTGNNNEAFQRKKLFERDTTKRYYSLECIYEHISAPSDNADMKFPFALLYGWLNAYVNGVFVGEPTQSVQLYNNAIYNYDDNYRIVSFSNGSKFNQTIHMACVIDTFDLKKYLYIDGILAVVVQCSSFDDAINLGLQSYTGHSVRWTQLAVWNESRASSDFMIYNMYL